MHSTSTERETNIAVWSTQTFDDLCHLKCSPFLFVLNYLQALTIISPQTLLGAQSLFFIISLSQEREVHIQYGTALPLLRLQ